MAVEIPIEIRVYDCCGMLGWYIPWSQWKAHPDFPLVPTRRFDHEHVYLYSDKAQYYLNRTLRPPMGAAIAPQMLGVVCLDNFVNPVTQAVMWHEVEREIRKQYLDRRRADRETGSVKADEPATKTPQGPAAPEAVAEEKG